MESLKEGVALYNVNIFSVDTLSNVHPVVFMWIKSESHNIVPEVCKSKLYVLQEVDLHGGAHSIFELLGNYLNVIALLGDSRYCYTNISVLMFYCNPNMKNVYFPYLMLQVPLGEGTSVYCFLSWWGHWVLLPGPIIFTCLVVNCTGFIVNHLTDSGKDKVEDIFSNSLWEIESFLELMFDR